MGIPIQMMGKQVKIGNYLINHTTRPHWFWSNYHSTISDAISDAREALQTSLSRRFSHHESWMLLLWKVRHLSFCLYYPSLLLLFILLNHLLPSLSLFLFIQDSWTEWMTVITIQNGSSLLNIILSLCSLHMLWEGC